MAQHTTDFPNAFDRYNEIRKLKKPGESFFDHFTDETKEEFEKFIQVFWKTEYPAIRAANLQYFSFINYKRNTKTYCLSKEELEGILDFLVLLGFLHEEKNLLSAEFAKTELLKNKFFGSEEPLFYSILGISNAAGTRFYIREFIATLRGNRGITNHYSHKKFKLDKDDYLP